MADHIPPTRQPTAAELARPPFRRATPDELNRETDARFWSTTRYKIGQKLDPKNPTDAAMTKVWLSTFADVKHQSDIGTLHLTFDKPEVAKGLADAQVAQQAANANANAAQVATDPGKRDAHAAEAALAQQVAQGKAAEVAAAAGHPAPPVPVQAAAAAEAAAAPPPPAAPASDHLAHKEATDPPAPAAETPSASWWGSGPPASASASATATVSPPPEPTLAPPVVTPPVKPIPKDQDTNANFKKALVWGIALAGVAALLYAATKGSGTQAQRGRVGAGGLQLPPRTPAISPELLDGGRIRGKVR